MVEAVARADFELGGLAVFVMPLVEVRVRRFSRAGEAAMNKTMVITVWVGGYI